MSSGEKQLAAMANAIRFLSADAIEKSKSGHPGMPLGMADVAAVLFSKFIKLNPEAPRWFDRDRFVLSAGHGSMLMYSLLYLMGYEDITIDDIMNFRQLGAKTAGHPEYGHLAGIDMTTGPLGQGISSAVGMALAGKVAGKNYRVYSILGDGEVAEGQVWEAMMAANKYHLDNLCACVDVNGLQIDGETKDVMPTEPLDKKFESFGWHVIKIDGHDFDQIEAAYKEAEQTKGQPTMILAKTIKGKGVSFMENNAGWHGKAPNDEQWAQAKAELEAQIKELEG